MDNFFLRVGVRFEGEEDVKRGARDEHWKENKAISVIMVCRMMSRKVENVFISDRKIEMRMSMWVEKVCESVNLS